MRALRNVVYSLRTQMTMNKLGEYLVFYRGIKINKTNTTNAKNHLQFRY